MGFKWTKFFFLALGFSVFVSCSRDANESSKLRIELPVLSSSSVSGKSVGLLPTKALIWIVILTPPTFLRSIVLAYLLVAQT